MTNLLRLSIFVLIGVSSASAATNSLSQFGITWRFLDPVEFGQFANGDFWVQGPVKIVSIEPDSSLTDGRTINGSMLNPKAGISVMQGFDSAMTAVGYSPALNAARPLGLPLSTSNVLAITGPASLISSRSHPNPGNRPQLLDAAVLTVLTSKPEEGSFRPPYCGTNKIILSAARIDHLRFRRLQRPQSTPSFESTIQYFARPWIEINTEYGGREMHPSNNQPDYGRDLANQLSIGLLMLQLDFSEAQKRQLAIRLIQYGIDVHGSAAAGGVWRENGGHNMGRKMPLLLAATALSDPVLLQYCDGSQNRVFQEDLQTFYVSQIDVERTQSPAWSPDLRGGTPIPYEISDIGTPEWGITHTKQPLADNKSWTATYRRVAGGATLGHILTARLMNLKEVWNHPAAFDYYDRYWSQEVAITPNANSPPLFIREMWQLYRGLPSAPTRLKATSP